MHLKLFFVEVCKLKLDEFNQLLSFALATPSKQGPGDKSHQHQISLKKIGNAENQTRGRWVRREVTIHCAIAPCTWELVRLIFFLFRETQGPLSHCVT